MKAKIANFLIFQVAWFACVWGAGNEKEWLGPAVSILLIALHLAVFARDRAGEARFLVLIASVGPLADALLGALGALRLEGTYLLGIWPPLWIVALWAMFAATARHSLAWMAQLNWALQFAFAAVVAPLSYLAGQRLSAVTIPAPFWRSVALIALVWGAALPSLFALSRKLESPS